MFTTERLRLRAALDSDYENIFKLWNTESVMRGAAASDYVVPRSPGYKEALQRMVDKTTMFAIVETKEETPVFIGLTDLHVREPKNRDADFGIMLAPEFWGKGYGTELTRFMVDYAFVELGLHRVSLGVFSHNVAAIALYKKIGFVEEGRKRKSTWVGGKWEDFISMGILEDEWAQLKDR
ncbi:hypothetical protein V5O48_001879 [Marasmius crinis-equi]|uniref:N-acetyltransferase domain-containing protein n=1 Tax=Marasmius crinis-equi TaxID=585013 RepID=A0ABR3FX45_9AGAR